MLEFLDIIRAVESGAFKIIRNSSMNFITNFLETANKVGDKVHARVPCDLKGSTFHCPYYIKKLSHEKHVAFNVIKNFSLGSNLENLIEFLNLLREHKNICGKVRSIKFSIKSKQFHQSIESDVMIFVIKMLGVLG